MDSERISLDKRLAIAEGQLKSVREMLKHEIDPRKLVQQVKAVRKALEVAGDKALCLHYQGEIQASSEPGKVLETYVTYATKMRS